jgi:hypothetical protein
MKRQLLGLAAVVLLAFGLGCVKDPTSTLRGTGVAVIQTSVSYVPVNVADSVVVTATELDGQGNILADLPDVTSLTPTVVTVAIADRPPTPGRRFYVRGVSYGVGQIVVSAGALADTIDVQTYPAKVEVAGAPDTLGSGATAQLSPQPLDAAGNPITVNDTFVWSSSATTIVAVDAAGLATGKAPGRATVTVVAPGGASGTASIVVAPGTFAGTVNPTSGSPGQSVTITRAAGGPDFDSDTQVFFNGVRTFIDSATATADQIQVVIPGIGVAGPVELLLTGMGADQIAQKMSFTSNTASFDDQYDPANDDPATAPAITANGNYYIVLNPGDENDFFAITAGASPLTVTVTASWFTAADVDILWADTGGNDLGFYGGATSANPEKSTVTIPAGTTYLIWLNLYAPGAASDLVQINVAGLP